MAELAFMHVDQNIFIFSFLTQIQTDVFCCSGMLAKDTICAEMAFMLMERNRPGSTIDYPLGGTSSIVDALRRGIEKYGGKIMLRSHVEEILVEGDATVVLMRVRMEAIWQC